jgi:hypothetical protein
MPVDAPVMTIAPLLAMVVLLGLPVRHFAGQVEIAAPAPAAREVVSIFGRPNDLRLERRRSPVYGT